MGKALLSRPGTFIRSLHEFANKQEPPTIKDLFAGILWVEIIAKYFPFLEWVRPKFVQELAKLLGKCGSALGCEVLAGNATAPVSAGNHDCLTM